MEYLNKQFRESGNLDRAAAASRVLLTALLMPAAAGCRGMWSDFVLRQSNGSAALYAQFRAYDGHTGHEISFENVAWRAAGADVVLFGEVHSNVVCNALEAQLLAAMSRQRRPVTLAMEFFETDTQASLDGYLDGRLTEGEFRTLTRQKRAYALAHRPLIEYCRSASIPVVAANAPSRLIKAYRQSGLTYDEFRETLDATDRGWLPRTSDMLEGDYYERFVEAMSHHPAPASAPASQPASASPAEAATQPAADEMPGKEGEAEEPATAETSLAKSGPSAGTIETANAGHSASQPAGDVNAHGDSGAAAHHAAPSDAKERMLRSYRVQLLWDDAMSESVANYRDRHPERRVMLIVGVFHVERDGGTRAKLRERRQDDSVLTIVFRAATETPLKFDEEDRGAGDIVIYGVTPPEANTGM